MIVNCATSEITYTQEELDALNKPFVPPTITSRQCRLELLTRDMLDDVDAMIAQQDRATQIAWEYATVFERQNPLLLALAANLGLTDAEIDEFFITANKL